MLARLITAAGLDRTGSDIRQLATNKLPTLLAFLSVFELTECRGLAIIHYIK